MEDSSSDIIFVSSRPCRKIQHQNVQPPQALPDFTLQTPQVILRAYEPPKPQGQNDSAATEEAGKQRIHKFKSIEIYEAWRQHVIHRALTPPTGATSKPSSGSSSSLKKRSSEELDSEDDARNVSAERAPKKRRSESAIVHLSGIEIEATEKQAERLLFLDVHDLDIDELRNLLGSGANFHRNGVTQKLSDYLSATASTDVKRRHFSTLLLGTLGEVLQVQDGLQKVYHHTCGMMDAFKEFSNVGKEYDKEKRMSCERALQKNMDIQKKVVEIIQKNLGSTTFF